MMRSSAFWNTKIGGPRCTARTAIPLFSLTVKPSITLRMIRSSDPDIIRPYLEDASNLSGGFANEVIFPQDEKEVSEILAEASNKKIPVTVAGNGTGLTGARIPFGGIVLSTEKL